MSQDKPSKSETVIAFVVLGVIVTIYTMVSGAVVNAFWWLVLKLYDKITKR